MIDLSHLKRVAGEATPFICWEVDACGFLYCNDHLAVQNWDSRKNEKEKAFIAAFNPEVAKQLIETLECAMGALSTINFPAIWLDEGSDGVVKCASEALTRISALIGKGKGEGEGK